MLKHWDEASYQEWLDSYKEHGLGYQEWLDSKGSAEREESKARYPYPSAVIDSRRIQSSVYRKRIDELPESTEVRRSVWNAAKDMLEHRSGTKYEDLAYIDSMTGKTVINKSYDDEKHAKPNKKMNAMLKNAEPYTIIGVHNHPGSSAPSLADIEVCIQRKYKYGIVACHDGKIYKYAILESEKFNNVIVQSALDRMSKGGYSERVKQMFADCGIEMDVM